MSKIKAKNTLYNDPRYDVVVDSRMLEQHLKEKDQQITELQKQLEKKEKDNQFFKKMYLSEKQKNDNYHTEKYGLDKPVEELRKIKLTPKEKEIYYKGFDNCERQFSTHIAELEQQLHELPKKIVEDFYDEIRHRAILEDDYCPDHNLERKYGVRKCLLENIRTTILKKYGDKNESNND